MEKEITTNEIMDFLRENMATKGDLAGLRSELKADIETLRVDTKLDLKELEIKMDAGFRMVLEKN